MHLDILIFAIIAAVLVYRLKSVLGTKHGEERPRPNPFAAPGQQKKPVVILKPVIKSGAKTSETEQLIDPAANKDGRINAGLAEIAAVDQGFDAAKFMAGAKYAFEMIVTSYAKGDRAALKPLLSPKIYADFDHGIAARELLARVSTIEIHSIKEARIIEAHLGGTMAYITIDFSVEQTTVTRDNSGAVVEGNPDQRSTVEDIWTFTRDTRSADPNWILIETRSAEKPAS